MKNYNETIGMNMQEFKAWHGGANWKRDLKNVVVEDDVVVDVVKKKQDTINITEGRTYTIEELKAGFGTHIDQELDRWIVEPQDGTHKNLPYIFRYIYNNSKKSEENFCELVKIRKMNEHEKIFNRKGVHLAALRMAHNGVLSEGYCMKDLFFNFIFDPYDYDDCPKAYQDYLRKKVELEKAIDWMADNDYITGSKSYMIDENTDVPTDIIDGALANYNSRDDYINEYGEFEQTMDKLNYVSTRQACFRNAGAIESLAEGIDLTRAQLQYAVCHGYYYNYNITDKGEQMFNVFKNVAPKVKSANNNSFTIDIFDDYNDEQELAEMMAHLHVVYGEAGTGKTTHLVCTAARMSKKFQVDIAAPTHTAKEKIRYDVRNFSLGTFPTKEIKEECASANWENIRINVIDTMHANCRKEGKPKVLFIDEASMIGEDKLWPMIESSLASYTQIYIYGDPFQLPPVKDKDCFNRIIELMEDWNPAGLTKLKQQHRTDRYEIMEYLEALRVGGLEDIYDVLNRIKTFRLGDAYIKANLSNQIIAHKRTTVKMINDYYADSNQRFITINNDLAHYNLYNGTFGTLLLDGKTIVFEGGREMRFDDVKDIIAPAAATTVHKMQGHECNGVFIGIECSNACDAFDEMMQDLGEDFARRFWYTAISRSKKCAAIITNCI